MKMTNEDLNIIKVAFQNNIDEIEVYYNFIKNHGQFKNVNERVIMDSISAFVGDSFINDQYNKGLDNNQIVTSSIEILKDTLKLN